MRQLQNNHVAIIPRGESTKIHQKAQPPHSMLWWAACSIEFNRTSRLSKNMLPWLCRNSKKELHHNLHLDSIDDTDHHRALTLPKFSTALCGRASLYKYTWTHEYPPYYWFFVFIKIYRFTCLLRWSVLNKVILNRLLPEGRMETIRSCGDTITIYLYSTIIICLYSGGICQNQ